MKFEFLPGSNLDFVYKVGCVFGMVAVALLPYAKSGRNEHREYAFHFTTYVHVQRYMSMDATIENRDINQAKI